MGHFRIRVQFGCHLSRSGTYHDSNRVSSSLNFDQLETVLLRWARVSRCEAEEARHCEIHVQPLTRNYSVKHRNTLRIGSIYGRIVLVDCGDRHWRTTEAKRASSDLDSTGASFKQRSGRARLSTASGAAEERVKCEEQKQRQKQG